MKPENLPVLIFMIPFLLTLILPLFRKKPGWVQGISIGALAGSLLASLCGLCKLQKASPLIHAMGGWLPPFGIEWRFDGLSVWMSLLVSAISLIVIIATAKNVRQNNKASCVSFYMAVLLNTAGLFGILLTHDLFNLFVFLEVTSLTTYALIATGHPLKGNVASLRYLLIGTVGASFYLLGVGYLYAAMGTLNMSDMAVRLATLGDSRTVIMGMLFIFLGFAIKMGLFPFHGWLPDSYTYASNPAASLIAPIATKVSIYGFIRVFITIFGMEKLMAMGVPKILVLLGIAAIVVGSIMAFIQKEFKRMLAYSSISHIGLIAVGIGLGHPLALVGALLHIVNHAVMKASFFLIATSAEEKHGVKNILDFEKLRGKMPHTMRALTLTALSMVGIPPLAGFFSKWYIIVGAVQSENLSLALVIVFSSLLTGLYFFKLIERLYFSGKKVKADSVHEGAPSLVLSYGALSISLFVLGYFAPSLLNWGLKNIAGTLF